MEAETGTCFIGELPDEILVAIASQLQVQRGFLAEAEAEEIRRCKNAVIVRSLHALTLCCRKLNAVATPFLYQCIIRTEQLITLLLSTLLQNPHLGRHIQYFEATRLMIQEPELYPMGSGQGFTKPICKIFGERSRAARWIVPYRDSAADTAFRGGPYPPGVDLMKISDLTLKITQRSIYACYNSGLVVLLSLADNLQDVAIEDQRSSIVILAFRQYSRPDSFRRLWLWSEHGESHSGYMLHYVCRDAKDPGSLPHYLRARFFSEARLSEFAPPITLEEVSFTVQDASRDMVDNRLRGCSSLKVFSCRWQWTDKFSPGFEVDLPRMYRTLEKYQNSLTHLTIDTTESAWRVDLDTFIPALGSLRGFKVLTHVDVAALVLWGDGDFWEPAPLSELLPESLEYLNLKTEWDEDIEDKLYQLSSECTISLPKLKRVECTWRPAPGFIADLLIDACHLAGVDLVLEVEKSQLPA
jgi:hypothetical protein